MKKSFLGALAFAFVAVSSAVMVPSKSEAIPAFARQVGMACSACHYQHFPKLNAFGRAFKLGGFVDVGSQELIEDDNLSIPAVLNSAYLIKVRYQKTNPNVPPVGALAKTGNDRGSLQFPDESSLFVAGRVAEHVGAMMELGAGTSQILNGGKVVFSYPVAFGKAGLSLYSTDAAGVGFGSMELSNTAALQRNVRGLEQRTGVYASQSVGMGNAATGLSAFAGGDLFLVSAGLWAPDGIGNRFDVGTSLSHNYRLAFTPSFGGFDLMFGLFGTGGTTMYTNIGNNGAATGRLNAAIANSARADGLSAVNAQLFGVDFQAQGEVAGMTLELSGQYVKSGKNVGAVTVGSVGSIFQNATAWNVVGELGVLHNAGLQLAYLSKGMNAQDGTSSKVGDYSAVTYGAYWEVAQNIELMLNYTTYGGTGTTGTDGRPSKSDLIVLFETAF